MWEEPPAVCMLGVRPKTDFVHVENATYTSRMRSLPVLTYVPSSILETMIREACETFPPCCIHEVPGGGVRFSHEARTSCPWHSQNVRQTRFNQEYATCTYENAGAPNALSPSSRRHFPADIATRIRVWNVRVRFGAGRGEDRDSANDIKSSPLSATPHPSSQVRSSFVDRLLSLVLAKKVGCVIAPGLALSKHMGGSKTV